MMVTLSRFALGATAIAVSACREVPVAPIVTPPATSRYVTFTLDTLTGFNLDVANQWNGVTLLIGADQSVHVVALDAWNGRLRYHGCASGCNDRAHWVHGTADSAYVPFGGVWIPGSGATLTGDELQAVYAWGGASGPAIRYAHCPGACNFAGHWVATTQFSNSGSVQSWEGYSMTPVAADAAGDLHVLFYDTTDGELHYGYCAATCDTPASWQDLPITGPYSGFQTWSRLIAVTPGGGVHVLYGTGAGLTHATCPGRCTVAANWTSEPVEGAYFLGAPEALSLAFARDGRLHVAFTDWSGVVTYATCASPCAATGAWSIASLPITTTDVSLATDGLGRLFLATTYRTVAVSTCRASCLNPASWETVQVDSALGGGRVSIAVDSAGYARVASSYGGFAAGPQVLQYTQMLQ